MVMTFRREREGDAAAIRTVVEAAFPTSAEADLVDALRMRGEVALSLVAVHRETVVGHAMLSPMRAPFPALGLAPVAVLPMMQGHGVGSRLIRFALDDAATAEWAAIFVLGRPRFYERFGFSSRLAAGFETDYPPPAFMVLPLRGALPTVHGRVDYAGAFAARKP